MELFLVAIAHPFFTNKQRHKFWMKREPATLSKYSGDVKVFVLPVNGVNYLSGFKLHLSAEMRRLCEGMKWLRVCWGGASPPGLALINWGLVRFVGLSVLKWASVSSSPSPRRLAWLPCCNSSSFPGFLSHVAFHSQRNDLKRKRLLPSPLLEVTLWAMMWWRRTRDNILTCTLLV